jgi:hypothetical protein
MQNRFDRHNSKQLCIEAYEKLLTDKRSLERQILNEVRFQEYQKNRPPAAQWYALKERTFHEECYRNNVALKPNNSNAIYLDRLQDKSIY